MQTAQEKGRQQTENSGFYGWQDNDRDDERAQNFAKNRLSSINNLPGAQSNAVRRHASTKEFVPVAMSSPRKGGADNSYKLRNGSNIQLHHAQRPPPGRPTRTAQQPTDNTFYRKNSVGAELIQAATEAPSTIYGKQTSHPMSKNKSSGVMLAIDQKLGQRVQGVKKAQEVPRPQRQMDIP